jgi:hypothetical protein
MLDGKWAKMLGDSRAASELDSLTKTIQISGFA